MKQASDSFVLLSSAGYALTPINPKSFLSVYRNCSVKSDVKGLTYIILYSSSTISSSKSNTLYFCLQLGIF